MLLKLQAAMASGLRSDETKPRRFDLTMSRRTRRPPAATSATISCHEQDHRQAVDVEGEGSHHHQLVVQEPEPEQPELDVPHQEQETSEQRSSQDTTQEEEEQEDEECQDNSRRFSLQELIEDEVVDGGVKDDAATGGMEDNAAAAAVRDAEEAAAAAEGEAKRPGQQQVSGRRVIGIVRRYVKVRSIKPTKRASPEKNAMPVC